MVAFARRPNDAQFGKGPFTGKPPASKPTIVAKPLPQPTPQSTGSGPIVAARVAPGRPVNGPAVHARPGQAASAPVAPKTIPPAIPVSVDASAKPNEARPGAGKTQDKDKIGKTARLIRDFIDAGITDDLKAILKEGTSLSSLPTLPGVNLTPKYKELLAGLTEDQWASLIADESVSMCNYILMGTNTAGFRRDLMKNRAAFMESMQKVKDASKGQRRAWLQQEPAKSLIDYVLKKNLEPWAGFFAGTVGFKWADGSCVFSGKGQELAKAYREGNADEIACASLRS